MYCFFVFSGGTEHLVVNLSSLKDDESLLKLKILTRYHELSQTQNSDKIQFNYLDLFSVNFYVQKYNFLLIFL